MGIIIGKVKRRKVKQSCLVKQLLKFCSGNQEKLHVIKRFFTGSVQVFRFQGIKLCDDSHTTAYFGL